MQHSNTSGQSSGALAAVAMVTTVRAMPLDTSASEGSERLMDLIRGYINELPAESVLTALYTLVILAARPLPDEALRQFALDMANGNAGTGT